jgi:succinylglutamic semialdehyde dehydrogenase
VRSLESPSGELLSCDPWDGAEVWRGPTATSDTIAAALSAARDALRYWSGTHAPPPDSRRDIITRLGALLKEHKEPFATLISRETGKVLWESRLEVDAMASKCAISIRAEAERRAPQPPAASGGGGGGGGGGVTYRPHGVALVLGPVNFPGHIAPALLAGNTVLFKPSEHAPATAEYLLKLLTLAGLPPCTVQILHGGAEVATQLIDSDINAVLFTGSYATGTAILSRLTTRPGVLTALEMGGNNPLIVWDIKDESLPAALLYILQSAFATAGQRCSCTRRLIIPTQQNGNKLLNAVTEAAACLQFGHPIQDTGAFFGTLISPRAVEHALGFQQKLIDRLAIPMLSMKPDSRSPSLLSPGVVQYDPIPEFADIELFAPFLQVHYANTFDEALAIANNTSYGLVSGLITDNPALWPTFRERARAGVLTLNRPTTGASSELPFGGIGNSGNHRPSAYFAADYCSYAVAEMISRQLALPETLPPGIDLS